MARRKTFRTFRGFRKFRNSVKTGHRHLLTAETLEFLEALAWTSQKRIETIDTDRILFRSQAGHAKDPVYQSPDPDQELEPEHIGDMVIPFDEERMKPRPNRATEGRANPKGLPVFYAASDEDTCIAEARPWVDSFLSVAEFALKSKCRIVDCSQNTMDVGVGTIVKFSLKEPNQSKREAFIWHEIDQAFAKPVTRNDDQADYLPTQIISELFRREGYDGIAYQSSVAEGLNIALFDVDNVELRDSKVVKVTAVKFEHKRLGDYML